MPVFTPANGLPTLIPDRKGQSNTARYYGTQAHRRAQEAAEARQQVEDREAAARAEAQRQADEQQRQQEALRRYNKTRATARARPSELDVMKARKEAYAEQEAQRQAAIAGLEAKRGRKF